MGTYKRLPRGKEKKHDEFIDWTLHTLLWIKNHWQGVLEVFAIALFAFAIWIGASNYWQWRSVSAAEQLFEASKLASQSEAQVSKLKDVIHDYSRTPAGQQAMMLLGDYYLAQKDYDKALEMFKKLAGRSRNRPMLMIAAWHKIGETLMAKGDYLPAAETYIKAAADPKNLISARSRFLAAKCFEKAGDTEKALDIYRQIMEEAGDKDNEMQSASEERLLWLLSSK